ncbi:MAG: hypothetical protein GY756_17155 [bacterium]|nr:hypothetical protein [bacterium]
MKKINKNRQLRELDHTLNFFTKGTSKKLHLLNINLVVKIISFVIKILLLEKKAYRNAIKLTLKRINININSLPISFNNFKILFISDLHIDILPEAKDKIKNILKIENYDICCFGGDFCFQNSGPSFFAQNAVSELITCIKNKTDIISILGNHDEYEFAEFLKGIGVKMLINDSIAIKKANESILISGIDDAGYYGSHDFDETLKNINQDNYSCKILLTHTPDIYKEAEAKGFDLCLAGHTHGGQLCLPGRVPILTETNAPLKMVYGKWSYKKMKGYTTSGVGCSGIPARFNCPPEVVIITLKNNTKHKV